MQAHKIPLYRSNKDLLGELEDHWLTQQNVDKMLRYSRKTALQGAL